MGNAFQPKAYSQLMAWYPILLSKVCWFAIGSWNTWNLMWHCDLIIITSLIFMSYRCHFRLHSQVYSVFLWWTMHTYIMEKAFWNYLSNLVCIFSNMILPFMPIEDFRCLYWILTSVLTQFEPYWRGILKDQGFYLSTQGTFGTWRWWDDVWFDADHGGHQCRWCCQLFYTCRLLLKLVMFCSIVDSCNNSRSRRIQCNLCLQNCPCFHGLFQVDNLSSLESHFAKFCHLHMGKSMVAIYAFSVNCW